ncbi:MULTISPECIES: sigma-54-dependent Fis family transcriptional regulator [Pseudomonas]|jgi:sigma-54-dependent transcriptional regulator|uniref:AAA domain-containing protein n=1 Tax=Pseudomonas bijieensis TaxID=2681983 RepID=A0A6N1CIV5_9PSED|nr:MULTISPECIES: sigma 54-interacting transcriptional regulator [Pseudomonas]AXP06093.1 sigma-54-dependent Fis family transcriptional regulator [Pseudomonas fluorescens]MCD9117973.1 sigma 54-interacting transcriptional regulator [Pseudomonas bijieensis]QIB05953.1 AAA domain-containing protein [Pseudomonas fluorescens]QKS83867.1 AAA domain-containing protein [Pseudomonas bijieensis]WLH62894.1 sigma 54-interacting transcriptional regulator [Pseudomonas sp. FP2300]
MFKKLSQPLDYAEALLAQFSNLSRLVDGAELVGNFIQGVARLSGCELVQLYLLDATRARLEMNTEYLEGLVQFRDPQSLSSDYHAEQLLQFSLRQNRVVCLGALSDSVHETRFLPARATPWQSLLCVPLVDPQDEVGGLLLCASNQHLDLHGVAESLGRLGTFALGQMHLLQRLRGPVDESVSDATSLPSGISYGLIGKSVAMRKTCSLLSKVLHSPYTVLLRGETGTGKEVVARVLHDYGPRRSKAFIVQNCAAVPENLLESELFGYRKGAFTGADRDRAGLFDAANGGTLLLDEIGDMPLSLQAKLLRVLQEGEIRPLGSNDTHHVDVRIIAATHRDLKQLMEEGKFREDLYYRLAQFPIQLPALRQRDGDIIELARHFADKACTLLRRDPVRWSDAALDHLAAYDFPGNVRELKSIVERAVLLCESGELLVEHFALHIQTPSERGRVNLRERMEQIERGLLIDCLRESAGNKTRAARELGLPLRTLIYRLARLNVQRSDFND